MNRLHLGCGKIAPEGWLNVDGSPNVLMGKWPMFRGMLIKAKLLPQTAKADYPSKIQRLNLAKPLPFASNTFDFVYSSHTLEHLYLAQTQALLRECVRVLKPGGVARMLVPDLQAIFEEYHGSRKLDWHSSNPEPACRADRVNLRLLMREPDCRAGGWAARINRLFFDLHSHKWMFDAESLAFHMTSAGLSRCHRKEFGDSAIAGIGEVELSARIEGGQGVCIEGWKPF
jgi:predicted SAM-dependent methyltransferase